MNLDPTKVANKTEEKKETKKKKKPRLRLARGSARAGGVTGDGERRPGCQGDGGCEVLDADVTESALKNIKKNSEESGRCPLLPSAGGVAGQNRSDAGSKAAERASSWGRDGGKSPGCHFALIRRRSTTREARERRQARVRSRERK